MTSLAELRAIEEERIASERAAVVAAAEAERKAIADAEAKRVADEAARVAAERDAALAIERAREAAEREARMRVEAIEATERARLAAALEHERAAQELILRREAVAKQRPTWMVVVTAAAILATGGFAWFAIDRQQASAAALEDQRAADRLREEAKAEAEESRVALVTFKQDLATLGGKVDQALDELERARTAEERRLAAEKLRKAREDKAALEAREEARKKKLADEIRKRGLHLNADCKHNVIGGKGCQ